MPAQIQARLAAAGAGEAEIAELLRYDERRFPPPAAGDAVAVPLADEPFVACWAAWAEEAARDTVWAVLRRSLPQLAFPIRDGLSREDGYRAATLRGVAVEEIPAATGLVLAHPELLELELYPSFAGRVPILFTRHRPDFVALVRALAKRNEPAAVPDGQGAVMVAGFNNWERVRRLRAVWEAQEPSARAAATWGEEFARIKEQKELYQDRFILLADGPYSAVPAADVGLAEKEWRATSRRLRAAHECTHYFTWRVYGSARNHLLDEVIADYTGIVAACGRFRADWLLRFLAVAPDPAAGAATRLALYRGDPPLSDRAFAVLRALVPAAAQNLAAFDVRLAPGPRSLADQARAVQALATLSLLELAAPEAPDRLVATADRRR